MEKRQIGFGDFRWPKGADKYIEQIRKTGRMTYGPICQKLEEEFGKICGTKYNIFCSSGTSALYTALGVLKNLHPKLAEERPIVILPAVTFVSDVNVVTANGFTPIFVDVGRNYNMNYSELEARLRDHHGKVFAVMPSSLMGRPIDGARIKDAIDKYGEGAFFVLDNCENISSKYDGKYPESLADFSAWSTYLSHLLVAGAVGGFIGSNNEKFAIYARSFINHGRSPEYLSIDDDNNVSDATLKDITAKRFRFVQHGLNFRMGELEAAMALAMLEDDFEGQLKRRKDNAEKIIAGLSRFELILPTFSEQEEARHMMLPIRLPSGNKWDLVTCLEANGIETREILPLHQPITEKYFGNITRFHTDFPMAWEIRERGLYVGCHQYLTNDDIEYMIKVFGDYFKK